MKHYWQQHWYQGLFLILTAVFLSILPSQPARADSDESPFPKREASAIPEKYAGLEQRDLRFHNGPVELAGSLVFPEGEGPFPAVVLIHGSEAATRDLFWGTGDAPVFLDAGLAVFIYDKRGTGASGGDWRSATIDDLAGDAVAAVDRVAAQPGINSRKVGLFGVSQGGRLAIDAAAQSDRAAFLIDVTGASVPFGSQERWGTGNELNRRGYSAGAIDMTMKVMDLLFSSRKLLGSGLLPLDDLYIWFVALDPYQDPADSWTRVEQPAFVAYGGQDTLVPSVESAAVVQQAFAGQPHQKSRLVIYPEAGHGIRLPNGSWDPKHIATMTGWLKATLNEETPAIPAAPAAFDPAPNRWYGYGYGPAPWTSAAVVQLPLLLLFLVGFSAALVLGFNPWANLRTANHKWLPRLALVAAGLLNLLLLAGLLLLIGHLAFADANGAGPQIPLSGLWPVLAGTAVVLALLLVILAGQALQRRFWTGRVRVVVVVVTVTAVAFIPFLAYWELLGPPL